MCLDAECKCFYTLWYTLVCCLQYSLGVKRDEMRKLEEIAQAEERKLELAEQFLEEDAAMFDEFLKENDKNSVEAIKMWVYRYFIEGLCERTVRSLEMDVLLLILLVVVFAELLAHSYLKDGKVWREKNKKMHW